MKNNEKLFQGLSSVLFALLFMGSVFLVSYKRYDLFETYRLFWTVVMGFLLLMSVCLGAVLSKGKYSLPIDTWLKTVCVTGVLEMVYALLQFFKVIPSFNRFYTYTGSFDNPAVFAMLLSVCVPVAVHFALRNRNSMLWWTAAALMYVFIGCSESRSGLIAATVSSFWVYLSADESLRRKLLSKRILAIAVPVILALAVLLYLFKADSANGRLLMWRVSFEMFLDRPLLGFGIDGFTSRYMQYQADFFLNHPGSPFILLADNVNNPFNEFLNVLVNFGLVGLLAVLAVLSFTVRTLYKGNDEHRHLLTGLILTIIVWCMFSYPLSVQFVWATILFILTAAFFTVLVNSRIVNLATSAACFVGIAAAIVCFIPQREWKIISERSLAGQTEAVLPDYSRLEKNLGHNGKFLYNYGAELHFSGHYNESLTVLDKCSLYLNDYDVQMLMADCYQNIGDTLNAVGRYRAASNMIPYKFLPLYNTMKLYIGQGDSLAAFNVANEILSKQVKVERSKTVQRIIEEASTLVTSMTGSE